VSRAARPQTSVRATRESSFSEGQGCVTERGATLTLDERAHVSLFLDFMSVPGPRRRVAYRVRTLGSPRFSVLL